MGSAPGTSWHVQAEVHPDGPAIAILEDGHGGHMVTALPGAGPAAGITGGIITIRFDVGAPTAWEALAASVQTIRAAWSGVLADPPELVRITVDSKSPLGREAQGGLG